MLAEPLAAIAHDACNIVAALQLYSDLLAEPGVLSEEHQYFASDLRTIIAIGSDLVQRMAEPERALLAAPKAKPQKHDAEIDDLATAVERLRGPLSAIAGKHVELELECLPVAGRVHLSAEALARILINLTRNAAEAMPHGGRIRITVQRGGGSSFFDFLDDRTNSLSRTALLCVQDSGPGIGEEQIGHLFDAGFTTKKGEAHRGLGLHIVRRLVTNAGGSVRVCSVPGRGARFEVELPLIGCAGAIPGFRADFPERRNIEC